MIGFVGTSLLFAKGKITSSGETLETLRSLLCPGEFLISEDGTAGGVPREGSDVSRP